MISAPKSPANFPIQLLVNYWEIVPSQMAAKLESLYNAGVRHIASFVPWQAVESDISHSLPRFLQAVVDRKMTISLIVTPELGVHFTSSGLPKDVMNRPDTAAQHFQKGPVQISLAPNSFHLPSLLAPEFTKRYYSFLSRIDNLLYDFEKTLDKSGGRSLNNITLVMTGGFWKYYRSPVASATGAYSGVAGDYSNNGGSAYRQAVEDFYSQPEFNDPNPAAAQRWKSQAMDEVNRRWFHQHSEAVFRNRTLQFVRKRASSVQLREIELFTPEADPALGYSFFLNAVSGCGSDFSRLSGVLEDSARLSTMAGYSPAVSYVHWSSLGGFRSLADTEKQFLILKSLLLMGPQGGGVLLDEQEWFSLSRGFRTHVEAFANSIGSGDLSLKSKALYLSPHLWSGPTAFWSDFSKKAGLAATRIASLDLALQSNDEARLLMVDPSFIITKEVMRKLVQWASHHGKVLVVPRSTLYTESARSALEIIASGSTRIEMQLGVSYRILPLEEGKLVIYDAPEKAFTQEMAAPEWRNFVSAVLSLAEIEPECQSSDSRVSLIQLQRKDQSSGLFVLNGSHRPVTADVIFPIDVSVSDLALEVRGNLSDTPEPAAVASARRFSLDVPACGILPLAIDRVGLGTLGEQKAADQLSRLGQDNAAAAAANELPGLGMDGDVSWN